MKRFTCFMVLAGCLLIIPFSSAWALNHLQANRIHIYNAGLCSHPTGPLWIEPQSGQAAPGFINVTAPGFDQIGALLTGNAPPQSEAALQAQTAPCGVIASFYQNATPVGAWFIPINKLENLISILQQNG